MENLKNMNILDLQYLLYQRHLGVALRQTKIWRNISDAMLWEILAGTKMIATETMDLTVIHQNAISDAEFDRMVENEDATEAEREYYTQKTYTMHVETGYCIDFMELHEFSGNSEMDASRTFLSGVAAILYLITHCENEKVQQNAYISTLPKPKTDHAKKALHRVYNCLQSVERMTEANCPTIVKNNALHHAACTIDEYRCICAEQILDLLDC